MHSRLSRMTPGVIASDLRTLATERCCHLANCSTVINASRSILLDGWPFIFKR